MGSAENCAADYTDVTQKCLSLVANGKGHFQSTEICSMTLLEKREFIILPQNTHAYQGSLANTNVENDHVTTCSSLSESFDLIQLSHCDSASLLPSPGVR
jgi:hypothetical protein